MSRRFSEDGDKTPPGNDIIVGIFIPSFSSHFVFSGFISKLGGHVRSRYFCSAKAHFRKACAGMCIFQNSLHLNVSIIVSLDDIVAR